MFQKKITYSSDETYEWGKQFGESLQANAIVCFFGDLGAGKTTFIKGIASSILEDEGDEIISPTFTYVNVL